MQLRFNCRYLEIDPREAVSSIETKQRHHGGHPVRPLWPNRTQLTRSTELEWDAQRRSISMLTLKLTLIRRAKPGPREGEGGGGVGVVDSDPWLHLLGLRRVIKTGQAFFLCPPPQAGFGWCPTFQPLSNLGFFGGELSEAGMRGTERSKINVDRDKNSPEWRTVHQ